MKELKEGMKAPQFTLQSSSGKSISLEDYLGKRVVLYFYPKDMTPGCTLEAQDFQSLQDKFKKANTVIFGVSKDSIKSHVKFREIEDITFELLSDETFEVLEEYGVWKEKSMYGKKYMGIERSTFIIDEKGILQKIYRKVSVPGHVDDVFSVCSE